MSQTLDEGSAAAPRFTQTQGQYLAFIYAYSRIFKRPPAEADMRRHFEVTAPYRFCAEKSVIISVERY
jgi:hypothetical protein